MISFIKILPVLIGMIVGGAGVAGLLKYTTPKVEPCPACVCNCPPQANVIDIDKLKNFKGTFKIEQHYDVDMDGDSLFFIKLQEELQKIKLARCK